MTQLTDEQTLALTDALTAISRALRTGQDPAAAADVVDASVQLLTTAPPATPSPA